MKERGERGGDGKGEGIRENRRDVQKGREREGGREFTI